MWLRFASLVFRKRTCSTAKKLAGVRLAQAKRFANCSNFMGNLKIDHRCKFIHCQTVSFAFASIKFAFTSYRAVPTGNRGNNQLSVPIREFHALFSMLKRCPIVAL
jgi:hypothetical protein